MVWLNPVDNCITLRYIAQFHCISTIAWININVILACHILWIAQCPIVLRISFPISFRNRKTSGHIRKTIWSQTIRDNYITDTLHRGVNVDVIDNFILVIVIINISVLPKVCCCITLGRYVFYTRSINRNGVPINLDFRWYGLFFINFTCSGRYLHINMATYWVMWINVIGVG